jgi:hypothetical protein
MKRYVLSVMCAVVVGVSGVNAQQADGRGGRGAPGAFTVVPRAGLQITESVPLELSPVKNAPFSAQAVMEFTQALGDGNRIERRFESSVARDSRGRTRREEQIALVGSLAAAAGDTPKLVTILDPDARMTYTLDESRRIAYRNSAATDDKSRQLEKLQAAVKSQARLLDSAAAPGSGGRGAEIEMKRAEAAARVATETLGTRTIEGVKAEGTRTTTTLPAGAIGNVLPIEIVSERWFSPELQMPVLITRRDPRSGETVYRLTNLVRAEPPDDLFTVPPGFDVQEGNLKFRLLQNADKAKAAEIDRRVKQLRAQPGN